MAETKKQTKKKSIKSKSIISLCKCYGCKKIYVLKVLEKVKVLVEDDDGYSTQVKFVCMKCKEQLNRIGFIQESEKARKQGGTNGESSTNGKTKG